MLGAGTLSFLPTDVSAYSPPCPQEGRGDGTGLDFSASIFLCRQPSAP